MDGGAFLHGKIDDEIFMSQPDEFRINGHENKVCRLNKALHGLKQARMIWNQILDDVLLNELIFQCTGADPASIIWNKACV